MANIASSKKANSAAKQSDNGMLPITFERVRAIAPSASQAEQISQAYGLDLVDYDMVFDVHKAAFVAMEIGRASCRERVFLSV